MAGARQRLGPSPLTTSIELWHSAKPFIPQLKARCYCEVTDRMSPPVQVFGRRDDDGRLALGRPGSEKHQGASRGQFGARPGGLLWD
jgi:hypothetical protein